MAEGLAEKGTDGVKEAWPPSDRDVAPFRAGAIAWETRRW